MVTFLHPLPQFSRGLTTALSRSQEALSPGHQVEVSVFWNLSPIPRAVTLNLSLHNWASGRLVCLSEQVSQFTWTTHCCCGMPGDLVFLGVIEQPSKGLLAGSSAQMCSEAVHEFLGLGISVFRTHSWRRMGLGS